MKLAKTLFAMLPLALTVGCHSSGNSDNANFFTPGEDQVALQDFADHQAAAAARADSSLYAAHFSGTHLNSLGQAKLNSLILGSNCGGLVRIYISEGSNTPEHRAAVTAYLNGRGWKSTQFAFADGPNPHSYTDAGKIVTDLDKLNGSSLSSDNSAGASAGSTASASAK